MLFNSHVFIFGFLPIVFFGFYGIARYSHNLAALWLTAASLFFYGWWDVRFVGLLLGSIVFNYGAGYLIGHRFFNKPKLLLTCAITSNLILLGYFKYANFFIENLNHLAGTALMTAEFILQKIDVCLPSPTVKHLSNHAIIFGRIYAVFGYGVI